MRWTLKYSSAIRCHHPHKTFGHRPLRVARRREHRALAAGGTLPPGDGTPCWDGTPERLAALQRGATVDLPLYGLPSWARVDEPLRWWRRAVVSADGSVVLRDDDGRLWLEENGLA